MRWVPTFLYGVALDQQLVLRLGVGLWSNAVPSDGGARYTAVGTPGNWILWQKHLLTVPLRFYEEEWPGVRALIEWGQSKASFLWIPETNQELMYVGQPTEFLVTLEAPRVTDVVAPVPDGAYPRLLGLNITLRQLNVVTS